MMIRVIFRFFCSLSLLHYAMKCQRNAIFKVWCENISHDRDLRSDRKRFFLCFCFSRSRLWGLCKNVCYVVAVVSRIDVSLYTAARELLLWKTGFFSVVSSTRLLFIDWKWNGYLDFVFYIFPPPDTLDISPIHAR